MTHADAPRGMPAHLQVKLAPRWRFDEAARAFRSLDTGETRSVLDGALSGATVVAVAPDYARADPKSLSRDEAYAEYGAESAIPLVASHEQLLVVRTLSKSHALAGLRVGYAIGQPHLIEALTRIKDSFNSYPLDRVAIAGSVAALDDLAWLAQTRARVIATRDRMSDALRARGARVLPSAANFIFASFPGRDAAELLTQLRGHKVLVVDCNEPTQLARVMQRNGWPEAQVRAVIAQQASRAQRRAIADAVIVNQGLDLAALDAEVARLWTLWGLFHPAPLKDGAGL